MSGTEQDRVRDRLKLAVAPVAGRLDLGGWISVAAGLLWPGQAALAAWLLAALIQGTAERLFAIATAGGFALLGILRAVLQERADRILSEAADEVLARERAALVRREACRSPVASGPSSAEIAALAGEKLAALSPYLTRYRPAQLRTAVLPPVLLALTAWHSWIAALILLVAGPLIPVFMALVGYAAREASERQMDEIGSLNDLLLDRLQALVDIRLLDAGDTVTADFATRAEALRSKTMEVLRIAFLSSTVLELFSALGVAMVAVYVGFSLLGTLAFGAWGEPLAPSAGMFLLLLAPDFFQPLRDLAAAWHDRAAAEAVARDLTEIEAQQPMQILGLDAPAALPRVLASGDDILRTRGLTVALSPGTHLTFPNLTLRRGETLALVGASGRGKSTLLAAIAGLVPVAQGTIWVDGRPLDATTAGDWRRRIGWVPQTPHFFAASLRANLRMSAPEASDDAIVTALATANAGDVVARLPRGLLTRLGETGTGVSGGEARRLMVARAALARPALVLADEPTANLDAETAGAVARGLLRLVEDGASLLVATHDPDLAARLDRQVILEVRQ
ncbi:thiol reductant ABC exporter subunit CydD [Tropicimonas sp. IMCC6043]|uniref:thiol reductant ABC exporter subunit CydD n=1 Tax=Tropicimonas sp. IMCC6043 TaxID=2510645 RepID=UPI00101D3DC5|nr:thiol reductant ABC exporter subunit CydD [Tropicimonas sp. IMCC6043]RYH08331.1 thiol reductant ABC exporter subunit CydD [Tropicimonas sp. IMCC6043]